MTSFFEGAVEQIGTKVASSFQAWLKASFNLKLIKNILKEIGPALLFQGDPLHALAGGDICFAPDLLGNGDEEVFHDRSDHLTKDRTFQTCLCKTDNNNNDNYDISSLYSRCASAKLMAATKTTQLQKPP